MQRIWLLGLMLLLFSPCRAENTLLTTPTIAATIPVYHCQIIGVYPHDTQAFTEGLVFSQAHFYESTGLLGQSSLRRVDPKTGTVVQKYRLPATYFAEGLTLLNDKIYQLTYESNKGFIYNQKTFQVEQTFQYPAQGWGLTTDGKQLIMSDGSAALIFLDPNTFHVTRYVIAHTDTQAVGSLNALAYIDGLIYANVWRTDWIAMISPTDGRVVGWIDILPLHPPRLGMDDVANGIAYDAKTKTLFLTGKNWPSVFAVKISRRAVG